MSQPPAAQSANWGFVCSVCEKRHAVGESEYTCTECGPAGILEAVGPPTTGERGLPITDLPGMWRYARLLALPLTSPRPPLVVGATPLEHAGRLGAALNLPNLFLKNDSVNPTGSLKDRASAAVLARAAEIGAQRVAVASTGNAGSSLAGLAASMGIPAVVFVPATAPQAKLVQALMYGAQVFAVHGSYDDAFELCLLACRRFGWYNRNTAYNPFTIEGKKTVAFEVYEQLGNRAPDLVFVPTGDGCILSGVARGFADLKRLGLIARTPRLIAVQADGSSSIARALTSGDPIARVDASSVADSITVNLPRNGAMAVRDIRNSGGRAVVVSDDAIVRAMYQLASTTGILAEPAAAASLAGLIALRHEEHLDRDTVIVLLVTGSGLKDMNAAARSAPAPVHISPTLAALEPYV